VYFLCFYGEECQPQAHHDQVIEINLQSDMRSQGQGQLNLHLLHARGSAATLTRGAEYRAAEPSPNDAPKRSQCLPTAQQDQSDLELLRHLHALGLDGAATAGVHQELRLRHGGRRAFRAQAIMRREMLELQRIIVRHPQRSYRDIDHVKGGCGVARAANSCRTSEG